jgi:hypothetical protein
LICNLQNRFEKEFLNGNWLRAEFLNSRATVVDFRYGLLLQDHSDSCIGCEEPMATQRQIRSKHPSRDTDLIGLIRAIDPVANGQRLMKSVDPCAGAGGPGPQCRGHILQIFLKENNSINPKNRWNLRIMQKYP